MKSSGKRLLGLTLLVLAAAAGQQALTGRPKPPPHTPQPLPELMAQAWLNVDAPPRRASLDGKWVIVSLTTLDCRTCRQDAPLMARIHRAIADRDDIVLVGFNTDPRDTPEAVRDYIAGVPGYRWPVGVGAEAMAVVMEAPYSPTLVLFNPQGQSVWRGHFAEHLAIELKDRLQVDSVQFDGRS